MEKEIILYVLTGLIFIYVLFKAWLYKIQLYGLMAYMLKKGYIPPTGKELSECSIDYLKYILKIKK